MLDPYHLTPGQFETFFLILVRVSTLLYVFPVFSAHQIPTLVRIGLALIVSFVLLPQQHALPALGLGELFSAVLSQVTIGLIVGFVAYLVFMGIQFAGQLLDIEIGFAVANVINPTTQQQVTVLGEFELTIATLLFLIANGHLMLLRGIAGSFTLVPLPYVHLHPAVMGDLLLFLELSFGVVFKIAAPAAVALFLTNIFLGLMARVAPQMNVFVVGFPLQVGLGMLMLAISIPLLAYSAPSLFDDTARQMDLVMRALR